MKAIREFCIKWEAPIVLCILVIIATAILCFITKNTSEPLLNNDYYSQEAFLRYDVRQLNPHSAEFREKLYSLFELWNKILQEDKTNLIMTVESLKRNVSIWVGLIAAICTILPIALTINVNEQFKELVKEKDRATTQFERLKVDMDFLNVAPKLRVTAEIQEFEGQEIVYLSNPKMMERLLNSICEQLNNCQRKYMQFMETDKNFKFAIEDSDIILSFNMMRKLLQNYEVTFEGHYLVRSQLIQDQLKKHISACVTNDSMDKLKEIQELVRYAQKVRDLFGEQFESKNRCQ
mgnify:CR=1 FL=1